MSDRIDAQQGKTPNTLRRKLVKGGLASSVVLATLASKPVLGAVPYNCTISGQLSGNTSSHGVAPCNSLGKSSAEWVASPYSSGNTDTLATLGVQNFFFFDGTNLSTVNTDPAATINKILTLTAPVGLEYAQKAVVLLLNATTDPTLYPLTKSQAKGLFVAAATNASFIDTNPDVTWTIAQVHGYIDLLYH